MDLFKAIIIDAAPEGQGPAVLREITTADLPDGDVLVRVAYSSLNYKDGLAVLGKGKVIRSFPMVPGIDLAGTVEESNSPRWKTGDKVILTGWGIGERHWGGYAQKARVKGEWLVPVPEGMSLEHTMSVGTAGLTAMLCVVALEERGLRPENGAEVLVTGAAGGVGSQSVALLAARGYEVAASTGRPEAHEYLKSLGARQVIDRSELGPLPGRPLEKERWAGAIDAVGGETLAAILRSMRYGGSVAACGLAGGTDLPTTVFPFILRGVSLLGVDSVLCPNDKRQAAWARIARDLTVEVLDQMTQVVGLESVIHYSGEILAGRVRGRVVVDVDACPRST